MASNPPHKFLLAAWAMILIWFSTFPIAAFLLIQPTASTQSANWFFYFAIEAVVLAGLSWFFHARYKRPLVAALCWLTNALITMLGFGLALTTHQPQMILGFFALSLALQLNMRPKRT